MRALLNAFYWSQVEDLDAETREQFDARLEEDPTEPKLFGNVDPDVMKVMAAAMMPQQTGASASHLDLWRPGKKL